MKREVLLLGDPALYEVSAAVTRGAGAAAPGY